MRPVSLNLDPLTQSQVAHWLIELQGGVQRPDGLLSAADMGVANAVCQTLQHRAWRLPRRFLVT